MHVRNLLIPQKMYECVLQFYKWCQHKLVFYKNVHIIHNLCRLIKQVVLRVQVGTLLLIHWWPRDWNTWAWDQMDFLVVHSQMVLQLSSWHGNNFDFNKIQEIYLWMQFQSTPVTIDYKSTIIKLKAHIYLNIFFDLTTLKLFLNFFLSIENIKILLCFINDVDEWVQG